MAQLRSRPTKTETVVKTELAITKKKSAVAKKPKVVKQTFTAKDEDVETVVKFPTTHKDRLEYVSDRTGKRVTPFQFKVYDLTRQIPKGHVTSYKAISDALKASPRAVGQALRINPFSPLPVPCHRVISSDYSIGGFSGGFGDHQLTANKKAKLMKEGCSFKENYIYKANVDGSTEFYSSFTL